MYCVEAGVAFRHTTVLQNCMTKTICTLDPVLVHSSTPADFKRWNAGQFYSREGQETTL